MEEYIVSYANTIIINAIFLNDRKYRFIYKQNHNKCLMTYIYIYIYITETFDFLLISPKLATSLLLFLNKIIFV